MRLSPAAELAIRGMLVLAEHHRPDGSMTLAAICKQRDLPKQYLTKIFGSLSRAGLVTPIRGKRGGYKLRRSPDEINMLQIIEAVEGPLALNYCQADPPQCNQLGCRMGAAWSELQAIIRDKLEGITLASCVMTAAPAFRSRPAAPIGPSAAAEA